MSIAKSTLRAIKRYLTAKDTASPMVGKLSSIHCYALTYSDYEVVNIRQSYHWSKAGAWKAWREFVQKDYEKQMEHIQLRGWKKERGRKYRKDFTLKIIEDKIEILP